MLRAISWHLSEANHLLRHKEGTAERAWAKGDMGTRVGCERSHLSELHHWRRCDDFPHFVHSPRRCQRETKSRK